MKLKTIIIDDEKFALEKLKVYVDKIPFLDLVASCTGTTEALEYLADNDADVIFTDIDMPDINGIRFVESLVSKPYVVFITAYRDFAVDGFRLSAVDYLMKPYDFADFQRAANKVLELYKKDTAEAAAGIAPDNSIFIKVESNYIRIEQGSIRYVKAFGEYLQIFACGQERPYMTLGAFGDLLRRLNNNFVQVHRSYVVNMNQVHRIEKNRIFMDENTIIPVGETYKLAFSTYLRSHAIGRLPK